MLSLELETVKAIKQEYLSWPCKTSIYTGCNLNQSPPTSTPTDTSQCLCHWSQSLLGANGAKGRRFRDDVLDVNCGLRGFLCLEEPCQGQGQFVENSGEKCVQLDILLADITHPGCSAGLICLKLIQLELLQVQVQADTSNDSRH